MHWHSSKFNIMSKLNNSKVMYLTLYPAPAFEQWQVAVAVRWSKSPLVGVILFTTNFVAMMMIFIRPLIGDVSYFITITALDSFWGHHHKAPSSIVHITNAVHSLFFQAMCFHSLLMTRHKWIHIWKLIDLPRTVSFLAKGEKASKPNIRSLCEKERFQICNSILVAVSDFSQVGQWLWKKSYLKVL